MNKLLIDFFPVLLFFIAYKIWGIFVATGILIAASAMQIIGLWVWQRRLESMHIITFVLVLVFGGLTIYLHDAEFLKWKVSIANWLFGAAFLFTQWFTKKTLIERLLAQSAQLDLPSQAWRTLNQLWGWFFIFVGTLNVIIIYAFSTEIWVDFKVFGILGLTIIFIVIQTAYLMKYVKHQLPKKK